MNFTTLIDKVSKYDCSKVVFVALGNEFRGDDASGIVFLTQLKKCQRFKNCFFINAGINPENHLERIIKLQPQLVVFIDSTKMNLKPGKIKFLNEDEIEIFDFSTHNYSIKLIKEYIEKHKKVDFLFIGIQPFDTTFKIGLSNSVKQGIEQFFKI